MDTYYDRLEQAGMEAIASFVFQDGISYELKQPIPETETAYIKKHLREAMAAEFGLGHTISVKEGRKNTSFKLLVIGGEDRAQIVYCVRSAEFSRYVQGDRKACFDAAFKAAQEAAILGEGDLGALQSRSAYLHRVRTAANTALHEHGNPAYEFITPDSADEHFLTKAGNLPVMIVFGGEIKARKLLKTA